MRVKGVELKALAMTINMGRTEPEGAPHGAVVQVPEKFGKNVGAYPGGTGTNVCPGTPGIGTHILTPQWEEIIIVVIIKMNGAVCPSPIFQPVPT
jgi:hypothetical protein